MSRNSNSTNVKEFEQYNCKKTLSIGVESLVKSANPCKMKFCNRVFDTYCPCISSVLVAIVNNMKQGCQTKIQKSCKPVVSEHQKILLLAQKRLPTINTRFQVVRRICNATDFKPTQKNIKNTKNMNSCCHEITTQRHQFSIM